jgi:hypothetical protein
MPREAGHETFVVGVAENRWKSAAKSGRFFERNRRNGFVRVAAMKSPLAAG